MALIGHLKSFVKLSVHTFTNCFLYELSLIELHMGSLYILDILCLIYELQVFFPSLQLSLFILLKVSFQNNYV